MATLLSRSLLRASRSVTPGRLSLIEQSLQGQRICQSASLRPGSSFRRISSSPWRNQYQTHTYDIGDGKPPVKVQIQDQPSFFRRAFRLAGRTIGGILVVTLGSTIALVIYEPSMVVAGEVRMATLPQEGVSDDLTLEVESYIQNHPYVEKLRQDQGLTETRPHLNIPPMFRVHTLTGGVLTGVDRITVPPLVFLDAEEKKLYSIMHVGDSLCGHPGIVHGGLLATILDETLAHCSFLALPNKVGMTANLNVNYRAPCKAGQFIVIKAETTKVEGRKAWVSARLESLPEPGATGDGKVLVEATALMIEPRVIKPLMREVIPSKSLEVPNGTA
ncbi:hypothetical protein Dda_5121 [Drechslerella dactyloides]|uniref:Thioesterase domain-containing protein n=1 Tax=Drechslerella dactyloides TaxID=74499 RepID=A0AAD6IVM5_DREDA|nr:hypothetical protein Dda_5121 [Drechslerella dactyloides]